MGVGFQILLPLFIILFETFGLSNLSMPNKSLILTVGIIPAIIILLWKNNAYLKQNLQSANELSSNLKNSNIKSAEQSIQHIFKSYNGKDSIGLYKKRLPKLFKHESVKRENP